MKGKKTGIIAALLLAIVFSVCGLVACGESEANSYSLSGENVTFTLSGEQTDTAKKGDEITVSYDTEFGYNYELTVKSGETLVTVENGKFTMPNGKVTATLTKTAILYTITAPNTVTFESGVENGKVTVESDVVFSLTLPEETYVTAVKVNETTLTEAEGKYSFAANAYLSETVSEIAVTVETDVKVYDLNATGATLKIGDNEVTSAKKGDKVTLIYKEFGYTYDVSVKCGDTDITVENDSFEMPAGNVTIVVTKTAVQYNVTAAKEVTVTEGVTDNKTMVEDTIKFTVAPEQGYNITGVTVNGTAVTAQDGVYSVVVAEYITEGGATAITISVTTEQITYALTSENVSFKSNDEETITGAHAGDEVTVSYEKAFGYTYTVMVKCGENDVEIVDGKFTMPYGNVTVTLEKEAIEYNISATDNALTFTEGVTEGKTTVEATVKFTIETDDSHGVENVKVNGTEITAVHGVYTFAAKDYLNENTTSINATYSTYNAVKMFSFAGINANYKNVKVSVEGSNGEQVMLEFRDSSNEMTDRIYGQINNNSVEFDLSGISNINQKYAFAVSASGTFATKITVDGIVNTVNVAEMLKMTAGESTQNGLTVSPISDMSYIDANGRLASVNAAWIQISLKYNGVAYKYFTIETTMFKWCGSGGKDWLGYYIYGSDTIVHDMQSNSTTWTENTDEYLKDDSQKVTDLWTCNQQYLNATGLTVGYAVKCAADWPVCQAGHGAAYACIGNIVFYNDTDLDIEKLRNDNENGLVFVQQDLAYKGEFGGTLKNVDITTESENVTINVYNAEKTLIAENLTATTKDGKAIFDLSSYNLSGMAYILVKNGAVVTNIDYKTVDSLDLGKYLYAKQEGQEYAYNGSITASTNPNIGTDTLKFDENGNWNALWGYQHSYIVVDYSALIGNIESITITGIKICKNCNDGGSEALKIWIADFFTVADIYEDKNGQTLSFDDITLPESALTAAGGLGYHCWVGCSDSNAEHAGEYVNPGIINVNLSYNVTEMVVM